MTTTFQTLRDIIARDYEVAAERLHPDTELAEIEIDSLGVIELIFTLEDEFKVSTEDTNTEFKTLGDIATSIDELVAQRDAKEERAGTAVTETEPAQ